MPTTSKKNALTTILFPSIFILLTALFFIIKCQSPLWVKALYSQGKLDAITHFLGLYTGHSLDYYLGRYEDVVFGPATQMISGLLFVALCLLYLKGTSFNIFLWAVFAYLTVTKLDVLFFPPYGDAIGGPWMEAIWLAHHKFNFAQLLHEPSYAEGGARVYVFSFYPAYLAALLTIFKSTKLCLAVNHLLVYLMTAVITATLRDILRKLYPDTIAILASLLFLYLPVTQTQTEAINMEIPCLLFVLWSAYYAVNKRFTAATLLAVGAVLAKGTGVLACAAIFVLSFLTFFFDQEHKGKSKVLVNGLTLMALAIVAVWLKFATHDQHVAIGGVKLFRGWESIIYYDPHLRSFLLSAILFLLYIPGRIIYSVLKKKNLKTFWQDHYVAITMFLFGIMWVMLFLNFYTITYRYRVILYPFMVFGSLYIVSLMLRPRWVQITGLLVLIILALLNSYGMYTNNYSEHNHVLLERSLEYRTDLKVNQRLAQAMETKYSSLTIGAPFMLAHILAFPELGYVSRPLNVIIYGFYSKFPQMPNYPGLANLDVSRTVYVTKQDELNSNFAFPLSEHDKVIETIENGTKRAQIFVGGMAIERMWRLIQLQRLQKSF